MEESPIVCILHFTILIAVVGIVLSLVFVFQWRQESDIAKSFREENYKLKTKIRSFEDELKESRKYQELYGHIVADKNELLNENAALKSRVEQIKQFLT